MLHNNHIPLFRLIIPFITGIVAAVYLLPELNIVLTMLLVAFLAYTILLVVPIFKRYSLRWIYGMLLYINLALAGVCLATISYASTSKNPAETTTTLVAKIYSAPKATQKKTKVIVQLQGVKNNQTWKSHSEKVMLYLPKDSFSLGIKTGDFIVFRSKLHETSKPKNSNEFNYKRYLSFQGIYYQAFLNEKEWRIYNNHHFSIKRLADNIRTSLIKILRQSGLESKELTVASALILGYKNEIDPQLKGAYSSAGAMHVLAVSGLHVGILFLIFNQLFQFMEKYRTGNIVKGFLLILILWSYAFITGLSPSVMRAATMFSFVITAKTINRNSNFFNTLAASAFALLIYNPLLIMEVGFQLSYVAVIGIVVIQPWINNWFSFNYWLPRKIWEITAVSLAAQLATFPLGLLYFHQFPNYFLLSNLIVIPLAMVILCLGLTTLLFSFVPLLGDWLGYLLNKIITLLNGSVTLIDSLPYSLSENIKFNIIDTWLIYATIISVVFLIGYRKFKYLLIGTLSLIAFLGANINFKLRIMEQKKMFIYNIDNHSALNFIDGKSNYLIAGQKLINSQNKLLFHVQNNWIQHNAKYADYIAIRDDNNIHKPNLFIKDHFIQYYNYRVVWIGKEYLLGNVKEKLNCDAVILTDNTNITIQQLLNIYKPKQIIIDASNANYKSEHWLKEAKKYNVACWSIINNGTFSINI